MGQRADNREDDLVSILRESTLYTELTPDEQCLLLKHVIEFYQPCSSDNSTEHENKAA